MIHNYAISGVMAESEDSFQSEGFEEKDSRVNSTTQNPLNVNTLGENVSNMEKQEENDQRNANQKAKVSNEMEFESKRSMSMHNNNIDDKNSKHEQSNKVERKQMLQGSYEKSSTVQDEGVDTCRKQILRRPKCPDDFAQERDGGSTSVDYDGEKRKRRDIAASFQPETTVKKLSYADTLKANIYQESHNSQQTKPQPSKVRLICHNR